MVEEMRFEHLMWKEDGWGYLPANDEIFNALKYIRELVKPRSVLEIGFYAGHSTSYMAEYFHPDCKIISCCPDHPRGRAYGDVVMEKYPNVTVHLTPSPDILEKVRDTEFDLVFVDGNHARKNVIDDTTVALILGAKYVLYDNTELPAVRGAVEEIVTNGNLKWVCDFPYHTNFKGGGVGEMKLYECVYKA